MKKGHIQYPSNKQSIIAHAHCLQNAFNRFGNQLLIEHKIDIKIDQVPILLTVYYLPSISQQEIADLNNRDKSSITRTVNSLVEKGLMTSARSKSDTRKNEVKLTKLGKKYSEKIMEITGAMDDCLVRFFKKHRVDIVRNIMLMEMAFETFFNTNIKT